MSPTYFVVHMAAAERQCELARKANDVPGMQAALAVMTGLYRAYYGSAPNTNSR
jgi:hypothetical protein